MDIANLGQPLLQGGLIDSISRFVGGNPGDDEEDLWTRRCRRRCTRSRITARRRVGARQPARWVGRAVRLPQLDVASLGKTIADPQASDRLMATSSEFLEKLMGNKLGGLVGAALVVRLAGLAA